MSEEESGDDGSVNGSKNSPSNQVLQLEYENAGQRIKTQQETIKSLSEEGTRYLRLLLILIGTPIAVLGALDPTTLTQLGTLIVSERCMFDSPFCFPIRYTTIAASFCLLVAALANISAGGYEAYNTRDKSNPEDVHKAVNLDGTFSDHLTTRLEDYRDRIEHNDRIIFSLDRILGTGKIALTYGIIIISLISYRLLAGTGVSIYWTSTLLVLIFILFYIFSSMIPNEIRAKQMKVFDPQYSLEYKKEIEKDGMAGEKEKDTDDSSKIKKEPG